MIDPIPSVAEVQRIAALADPVLRNLLITQCYHELAVVVARRTGIAANWCAFATWASKQAGQTIRGEDLPQALEAAHLPPFAVRPVWDVIEAAQAFGSTLSRAAASESLADVLSPLAAVRRASDAVARGNKKVYEEIGAEFARFIAECLDDSTPDEDKIARFAEALRPGDPPDGQRYLRQAFGRLYRILFEPDPQTRAQLLLLANLEIGLHEQTRLQPEITEALDAALPDRRAFGRRLLRALFPFGGLLARLTLFVQRLLGRPVPFEAAIDALWVEVRRQSHAVVTEYLMTIGLPGGVRVRLGDDLSATFPASLRTLALPDLLALLAQVDSTPDSPLGSGARDWADLAERMHFIADLFRCYHESADLFLPPFTAEQVLALRAGQRPRGPL